MGPSFLQTARERGVRFWVPIGVLAALIGGLLLAPLPFLEKLRILSAGVCAQRLGHSLLYGGVQPPLESRMIGIYGGFFVALATLYALGRGRAWQMPAVPILALAVLFIGVMGFDGTNALFFDLGLVHLYPPDNRLRLFTGTLSGVGIALLITPIVNYTLWRHPDDRPVADWRVLGIILGVSAAFNGVALTGFGWLLYPISIVSVAGITILLIMIMLLLTLAVLRREGHAQSWADLLGPTTIATCLAVAALLALAAFRFWAEAVLGITLP
ncbi:MAG: DUF2085 domain-containing protein [Dehalococcoidia bacterium]|nr:DUF2085 domain-containing protein [Dehalococcoidia bacterium]